MRIGKVLRWSLAGVAAVVVIPLIAVRLAVSPNDFKPRIAAAVGQDTGREFELKGDIKLAVFPWIALELGEASLGNPPGFSGLPLLSFKHAAVRVRLLPLLAKRLEIGRIEIDGLDVSLVRNAAGKGNWEDLGHEGAEAPAEEPAAAPAPAKSGEGVRGLGIAGISVTDARVSYGQYTVQHVKFETGSIATHGAVPVTLHVEADRGVAGEHAGLDARFNFSADPGAKRFTVAALSVNGEVALAGLDRPLVCNVAAPVINLNLAAQTLNAPAFTLNLAGAQVNGSLEGAQIVDAPTLTGTLTLAPLLVREFLPRVGVTVPTTRDPRALSSVTASGSFTYGANAARVDHLKTTLDETHLTGSVAIENLQTRAIGFTLAVDTFDLDRYLPPATGTPKPAPGAPVLGAAPAASAETASTPLDANGTLTVGSLHAAPLDLSNVKVTVATKDKVMRIFPLTAQVNGGEYTGDITLDNRIFVPALSLDEHLTGIDVGKLASAESKKLHVSGRGNVNLKVTGRGAGTDAILKSLDGHMDMNVANGAVEGVDVGYEIGRAEALVGHAGTPAPQNTKRTAFDALKLSAEITKGVAVTKDILLSSAAIKITGAGSANLSAQTLDLALQADTRKTLQNVPIQIPVKVTGSLTDPTVRPDVEQLAKGELKEKVKDVLQDKLKGLFGKP